MLPDSTDEKVTAQPTGMAESGTTPVPNKTFFTKTRTFILAFVILVIASVLGIFFYRQSQPKSLGQITFGWNTWPGNLPYLVAYDKGFFKEQGLEVQMTAEESYSKKVDDLMTDKIDFSGDMVLIDIVEKVSKGNSLKVVLATDYSNGADGIVAKKEIKDISELKGKKVAVEMGTLSEYLLYDALIKNKLNLSDVQEVNMTAQEAAQAFIRGEVDAAVTYEPDYSQAVEKGDGWRIYTSAESPGLIIDVLTFKSDFVAKNPAKVSAVVTSYFKAMDFIAANPDKAYEIGAKYFKITPSEFKEQYVGIRQIALEDNLSMMSYGSGSDSLHELTQSANNFLKIKGTIKGDVDSTEILDPRFIRAITK